MTLTRSLGKHDQVAENDDDEKSSNVAFDLDNLTKNNNTCPF